MYLFLHLFFPGNDFLSCEICNDFYGFLFDMVSSIVRCFIYLFIPFGTGLDKLVCYITESRNPHVVINRPPQLQVSSYKA